MEVDLLPVSGDVVKCGLRKDRPKEQRYHYPWVSLGIDVRHMGDGEFVEARISACGECGTDRVKRLHRKPKIVEPVKVMDPVRKAYRDALRRELFDAGITGQERERALTEFDQFWNEGDNE